MNLLFDIDFYIFVSNYFYLDFLGFLNIIDIYKNNKTTVKYIFTLLFYIIFCLFEELQIFFYFILTKLIIMLYLDNNKKGKYGNKYKIRTRNNECM